ncbi:MAG: hypothetical protein WDW38_003953 [Sanguina aurantia]
MATNLECSDSIRGHVIDDGEKLRLLEAVVEQQDDELLESAHKKSATAASSDVAKASDQKHSDSKTRIVSWTELESHTESDSLWIAVEGKAYDVTEWSISHPGGVRLLHLYAGKDATDPFLAYHPSRIKSLLPKFLVGTMASPNQAPISSSTAEFRKLAVTLEQAGLYKTDITQYYYIAALLVTLFSATFWLVGHGHIFLGAFTLGAFWQQLALVGHDVGHNCVVRSRKTGQWIMLAVNIGLGIGSSFWMDNHNAHHGVVNSSDCDPEVQFMPFIATSPLHFDHTKKHMSSAERTYGFVTKQLVSVQHFTMLPLLCFARYKFYIQAFGHLAMGKIYINWYLEIASELLFFAWYTALTCLLPTWQERVLWIVVSHASDWVLYLQTVITHFPREITASWDALSWVDGQAAGTLNWSCPRWLDWFHGGLQFQIEHHLFPRLPRHNLRKAAALIRPMCEQHNVDYHCPTFWGAIMETLDALKSVAVEAQKPMAPA